MMPVAGLTLQDGMTRSDMTFEELWLRQISVGGQAAELEIEAYVLGLLQVDSYQHDVIAQALNEHFVERGEDHPVGYSWVESPLLQSESSDAEGTSDAR